MKRWQHRVRIAKPRKRRGGEAGHGTSTERPVRRHSRLSRRLLSCVVALAALAISAACIACAVTAHAAASTITVSDLPSNPNSSGSEGRFIRVDGPTSSVAYCAQGWLKTPTVGQTLEWYGSLEIPELDYVLYHGYDGAVVTSVFGLDETRSESATAAAVWLAIGEQRGDILNFIPKYDEPFHGNKMYLERWQAIEDQGIKDAAWRLYQDGLAYKNGGGGGDEAGCATLWLNRTPYGPNGTFDYQCLVTSDKKVMARFTKVSADASVTDGNGTYSLEGASYDIFRASDDRKVASVTTGPDGHASCQLQPNTRYYALETEPPAGFKPNDKRIEFTTGMTPSTVELPDEPATFTLVVAKRDAATNGIAQPGATLEGARYKLVSVSTPGFERTGETDADGRIEFGEIPLGTIRITETKAPEGYVLDETVHEYTVTPDDLNGDAELTLMPEHDFAENPIAFDIEIAKFLEDGSANGSELKDPAAGVSFEIVSNTTDDVVGTITTGDDGYATTEGLWFGEGDRTDGIAGALPYDRAGYTVREVPSTVPEGFEPIGEWKIGSEQLADGATLRYILDNRVVATRLQLVKIDAATDERIPLAGFSFQILDENGDPLSQNCWYPNHVETDVFTTDETGSVTLPELLRAGSYLIREVAAPEPYIVTDEDIPFEVKAGSTEPITVISVENEAAKGRATIVKTCSEDGKTLKGAEYDVVAQEDIYSPTGSLQAGSGEVLDHVTTGKDGTATTSELPLGDGSATYAFVETEAPAGHVLDPTPRTFTLSYEDRQTPVVEARVEASDEPTRVDIEKTRLGAEGVAVPGAVFELERVKEDPGPREKRQDGETERYTTDEEGRIRFGHLEAGTYRLREVEAPAGYLVNDEVVEFHVADDGTVDGAGHATITVEDDVTKVDISKRDITDEEELPGAQLAIIDEHGDMIESWTSGSEPHRIEMLEPGTYTLVELITPRTYDQATTVEFTVEETGGVQTVTMYDEPVEVSGEVDKRQEIADPVASDTSENGDGRNTASVSVSAEGRYDYSIDLRNTSSTWVDEFTMTDEIDGAEQGLAELEGIATPRARGDFDGKMNVWYRTNRQDADPEQSDANATLDDGHENPWLRDPSVTDQIGGDGRVLDYTGWRLWKRDVSTTEPRDLEVADLGLLEDERVVAVRFEYGRVEEGFTTREGSWDRENLKDPHDDLDDIPGEHEGEPVGDDPQAGELSPAVLHLRVTGSYRDGVELVNRARLDLYRNGGGDRLEDHDEDVVVQVPLTVVPLLDQTGVLPIALLLAATAAGGIAVAATARRRPDPS